MNFHLGINTGFAVNRYSEPEEWVRIVGEELGLQHVQFTADMLNPDLPAEVLNDHVKRILNACDRYGVRVTSTFTGAFTRVNHLAHPDRAVRRHWVDWFKRFADLSVDLGAKSMGSHFGIFTHRDNGHRDMRDERRRQNIEGWREVGHYAREKGLQFINWESMSISREQGETIKAARALQDDVNKGAPLPFKICLDVDHGDVTSPDPDDTDPHAWIRAFSKDMSMLHLKQSSRDKGGHWPFTAEHNARGRIVPERIVSTLRESGASDVELLLELSFRERDPVDRTVVEVLKESVSYWREVIVN